MAACARRRSTGATSKASPTTAVRARVPRARARGPRRAHGGAAGWLAEHGFDPARCASACSDQREHPGREPGPVDELERRDDHDRARRRQLGQVRELRQAVLARAEQEVVDRERRVERVREPGVGADGLARRSRRSRDVSASQRARPASGPGRLAAVEERLLVVGARVPAGAQEQPAARRQRRRARSPRPGCRPA